MHERAADVFQEGSLPPSSPPLRVCVIGLGGGGHHWEAQKIISSMKRHLELVLVYAGPMGGLLYWDTEHAVVAKYHVRSPSLHGDPLPRKFTGMVENLWQAAKIIRKVRPDVILGVGTAQAVPFGIAARFTGTAFWFVESVTRMRAPSRTARIVFRLGLAERFYYFSRDLRPVFKGGICMEEAKE